MLPNPIQYTALQSYFVTKFIRMQIHQITGKSSLLKKYFIKRRSLKQSPLILNSSIFQGSIEDEDNATPQKDPFQKYRTMTTNIENTSTIHQGCQDSRCTRLRSCREQTGDVLPKISKRLNFSLEAETQPEKAQKQYSTLQLKKKELICHISDPFYLNMEKTISKRVQNKHISYQRKWLNATSKRKGRSLLNHSLERASEHVKQINLDAQRRMNTIKLEEMLRDNIKQRHFVKPGELNPEIEGLKGKGGRVIPMFEQIYMLDQVYRVDKRKQ